MLMKRWCKNSIRYVSVDLFERNLCCDSDKNGETRGYNLLKIFSSSYETVDSKLIGL